MTEILTESFCERCGTRYTFEPVGSRRKKPLSAIGTLGRGIRHFVSDPGTSLDEAFAVARSEQEQRSTATALEAFHRAFNFCLSCRQYTCGDCWNAVEGRCLSCAPTAEAAPPVTRVDIAVALPPMDLAPVPAPVAAQATAESVAQAEKEAAALAAAEAEAEARAIAEAEAVAAAVAEAAALSALAAAEAEAEARAIAVAEAVAAAEAAAEARAIAEAEAVAQAALLAEQEVRAAAEAEAAALAAAEDEAEARALAEAEAEARAIAEAEEAAAVAQAALLAEQEARAAAEAEAAALAAAEAEAEARAIAEAEAEAAEVAAAEATSGNVDPMLAFQPGLNLDDEIAAYERQVAARPDEHAHAVAAEPEAVAAEPEAVAAEVAHTGTAIEPIPTAIGQPLPASVVDGPVSWPEPEIAAAAFEPHWPDIPVPHRAGAGLPSVEQAPAPLAARACPSCGLSLSASARFCRRCGTPQQVGDSPR